jgi:hypothetical protein
VDNLDRPFDTRDVGSEGCWPKDVRGHCSHLSDDRPEGHLGEDITLDVDPGCDFDQFQAFAAQAKDSSFGDK